MREIIFLNEDAVTRKIRELRQKKDQASSDEEKAAIQAQIDRIDSTGEGQLRVATANRNKKLIKAIKDGDIQGDRAMQYQDQMNANSFDARLQKLQTHHGYNPHTTEYGLPIKRYEKSDDERQAVNKHNAQVIERGTQALIPGFGYRDYTRKHNYNMHDSSRHTDRYAEDAAADKSYTENLRWRAAMRRRSKKTNG